MFRSRTPPPPRARSSRSTRSARGGTKNRRASKGGGFADQIRRAAESGPAQKWVKVERAPAPRIRFMVSKWVPINELTEEERQNYEDKEKREFATTDKGHSASAEVGGLQEQMSESPALATVSAMQDIENQTESENITPTRLPLEVASVSQDNKNPTHLEKTTHSTTDFDPAVKRDNQDLTSDLNNLLDDTPTKALEEPPSKRVKTEESPATEPLPVVTFDPMAVSKGEEAPSVNLN